MEVQRCSDSEMFPGWCRVVKRDAERCREIQRCSIGVEMWRCRGVERCSGSAEVNHSHTCRGARAAKAKVQRRCRIEYMNMSKAGAEVQRGREAERQRGDAEMLHRCRCRDVEVQMCRGAECRVQSRCESSVVLWCRGAEMQHRCRDLEM